MKPDAETLERLRRSGIRIDRDGQFIHEGQPVRHEGLRRALFRWLDRDDEHPERYVLRLDERRFAYLDVDDTPLVVRAVRADAGDGSGEGGGIRLALSDGAEEPLDPATLTVDDDGILRCRVRGGRLEARLDTSAAATLAERITETPSGPVLSPPAVPGAGAVPIPRRPPPTSPTSTPTPPTLPPTLPPPRRARRPG
jgi:hypothetical protein